MKAWRLATEGTVGLITYMRTDSTRVSPDAIAEAREFIGKLGAQYLPATPNEYAGKKQEQAQDAHEAIRPTNVAYTPESIRRYLSDEQFRLYRLIWQRFVSSQMTPAVFDQTTVDIVAKAKQAYDFRVTGSVLKFDGLLKFEEEDKRARAGGEGQAARREAAVGSCSRMREAKERRGAQAAGVERWRGAAAGEAGSAAEVYAASAALQRSEPGEDAGREGNWAAFDVCLHH